MNALPYVMSLSERGTPTVNAGTSIRNFTTANFAAISNTENVVAVRIIPPNLRARHDVGSSHNVLLNGAYDTISFATFLEPSRRLYEERAESVVGAGFPVGCRHVGDEDADR